jgi:hypothetical protein
MRCHEVDETFEEKHRAATRVVTSAWARTVAPKLVNPNPVIDCQSEVEGEMLRAPERVGTVPASPKGGE